MKWPTLTIYANGAPILVLPLWFIVLQMAGLTKPDVDLTFNLEAGDLTAAGWIEWPVHLDGDS